MKMSSDHEDCLCYILKNLELEFERELLAANENRAVDWTFAKNAIQQLAVNDGLNDLCLVNPKFHITSYPIHRLTFHDNEETFRKIFEFMMTSFDILNLREATLAVDLMRHAFYFAHVNLTNSDISVDLTFEFGENDGGMWCLCERKKCETFILTETQFRQLLKTPYNTPYSMIEEEREQIHKHVVWCAVREGQERILSGFLKYGVMFLPPPNYARDRFRYRVALNQLLLFRENYEPPADFTWNNVDDFCQGDKERRPFTIMRVLELLTIEMKARSRRPEAGEPPQSEGPCLAENAEDISSCKSVYFRCLRRTFETIPEPFVSSNEVRKILRRAYGMIWDELLDLCINEIVVDFEELYPEGKEPVAPRSLQHLSRCQVRENLRQSGALPYGIKELGIPMKVQKYIALEERIPLISTPEIWLSSGVY